MSNSAPRDWKPFLILPRDVRPAAPRDIKTVEGIGDRLRTAAFAEIQARDAFLWAADRFQDAPPGLADAWRKLAADEERHMNSLLRRMTELGLDVQERGVSDWLWVSLMTCESARGFATFMAGAEERGRKAGVRFYETLAQTDPVSAEIFRVIAEEEVEHINLASRFFPEETQARVE
ncbi:MAG TPA: DUF455 family protein, partial [Pirellulales bacterium]